MKTLPHVPGLATGRAGVGSRQASSRALLTTGDDPALRLQNLVLFLGPREPVQPSPPPPNPPDS